MHSTEPEAFPGIAGVGQTKPNIQQHGHSPHLRRKTRRRLMAAILAGIVLAGIGSAFGVLNGILPNPAGLGTVTTAQDLEGDHTPEIPTVKVVQPKRDNSAEMTLERIATVEPYYRADLRARASGIVKRVYYDIGEEVKRGAVLIEIDVAESEQDVAQKRAIIIQREQELKVSEAKLKDSQAARGVTAAAISQREAEVQASTATRDLKKRKLDRYRELAARGSVVGNVVEEEERDYLSSEAGLLAASANVARAQADHLEAAAKIEAATADVELKRAQIEVARRDLDRARVVADFGKVVAPFDGVVVRRNVDPGSFVQNATTGSSETLVSISRIDLVTVIAQFPDNAAPYITQGTPAVIQITDFSGAAIFTNVTRLSPTIQNSDRTIRVEIDLFNGGPGALSRRRQLLDGGPDERHLKGSTDTFPKPAFKSDVDARRLLPGMNAAMKLSIPGSGGAASVLPSTAVFSKSGAKYILLVADGKTRAVPVQIHLNDGQKVRVSIVDRKTTDDGTVHEELTDLKGDELVVISNQLQIGDGVDVRTSSTNW
jgi:multidrug resistance efflux pump